MPDIKGLGARQTSYADLIGNGATSAARLRAQFLTILGSRHFPDIDVFEDKITIGLRSRPYTFVRHKSGARMTLALREYGVDLLVTWTLWFGSSLNWALVGGAAALFLLGLFTVARPTVFGALCILAAIGLLIFGTAQGLLSKKLDFFAEEDMAALGRAVNTSLQQAIDDIGLEYKLRELEMPSDLSGKRRRAI